MNETQCSELFSDVFSAHCGGCARTCECGITWFDDTCPSDFDMGELEEFQARERALPAKYKSCDHSIGAIEINNIQIVHGCTCGLARKYENFIIGHEVQIAEYLNKRSEILRHKADRIKIKGGNK